MFNSHRDYYPRRVVEIVAEQAKQLVLETRFFEVPDDEAADGLREFAEAYGKLGVANVRLGTAIRDMLGYGDPAKARPVLVCYASKRDICSPYWSEMAPVAHVLASDGFFIAGRWFQTNSHYVSHPGAARQPRVLAIMFILPMSMWPYWQRVQKTQPTLWTAKPSGQRRKFAAQHKVA